MSAHDRVRTPPEDGPPEAISAAEFLRPVLLSLSESVRENSHRVVASARRGAAAATDEEAVHDFRVALRRLRTLLRPARKVYGKKRLRPIEGDLRTFAQATGAVRDEEVLRETLASLELPAEVRAAVDRWVARRARQERARRARVIELVRRDRHAGDRGALSKSTPPPSEGGEARGTQTRSPTGAARGRAASPRGAAPAGAPEEAAGAEPPPIELEPCLVRLEKHVARAKTKQMKRRRAEELARTAIDDTLRDVRALAACDPADGAAMHALRIRFKRLRYSAETFAPLLGDRAEPLVKSASRMQRRLGQLHDVDEAIIRTGRARGLSPEQRGAVLVALRAARTRAIVKVKEELALELDALATHWSTATP